MNKKYFFFDIDGTLTNRETGVVIPSALEAIEKLREAGHFVSIATGRAQYKARKFMEENGFEHMVCNGGNGIVVNHNVVENQGIDKDKAIQIYQEARQLGYGVLAAIDDTPDVYTEDFRFYDQCGLRQERTTYHIDESFELEKQESIYKLYISIPKEEEGRLTSKDLLPSIRFVPEYLMYQADAKEKGILRMLEYIQGKPEDVVVFGDDYNDMVMFQNPFYGVAMSNACEELKRKADFVTKANIEDGIYYACKEQGWFDSIR